MRLCRFARLQLDCRAPPMMSASASGTLIRTAGLIYNVRSFVLISDEECLDG